MKVGWYCKTCKTVGQISIDGLHTGEEIIAAIRTTHEPNTRGGTPLYYFDLHPDARVRDCPNEGTIRITIPRELAGPYLVTVVHIQ